VVARDQIPAQAAMIVRCFLGIAGTSRRRRDRRKESKGTDRLGVAGADIRAALGAAAGGVGEDETVVMIGSLRRLRRLAMTRLDRYGGCAASR
jgi:hypothetical protein